MNKNLFASRAVFLLLLLPVLVTLLNLSLLSTAAVDAEQPKKQDATTTTTTTTPENGATRRSGRRGLSVDPFFDDFFAAEEDDFNLDADDLFFNDFFGQRQRRNNAALSPFFGRDNTAGLLDLFDDSDSLFFRPRFQRRSFVSPMVSTLARAQRQLENARRLMMTWNQQLQQVAQQQQQQQRSESSVPAESSNTYRVQLWQPRVDVSETDLSLHVDAALPGAKKDDIQIDVEDNVLTIRGTISQSKRTENQRWHVTERQVGEYARSFRLPDNADVQDIKAALTDGVLSLDIPKVPIAADKKTPVSTAKRTIKLA